MSRRERSSDGFWSKVLVATIVVVWVSLVAGNWLGNYAIEKGVFGKGSSDGEFVKMPDARPRPWLKVDPNLQQELERQRNRVGFKSPTEPKEVVTASPVPAKSAKPADKSEDKKAEDKPEAEKSKSPEDQAMAEPGPATSAEPAPAPTPATAATSAPEATPAATPEPAPTPALGARENADVELQFGSFSNEQNANELMKSLEGQGQQVRLDAIPTDNGTVYRIRGTGYTGEQDAKAQVERLKEQGIDAFIVNH